MECMGYIYIYIASYDSHTLHGTGIGLPPQKDPPGTTPGRFSASMAVPDTSRLGFGCQGVPKPPGLEGPGIRDQVSQETLDVRQAPTPLARRYVDPLGAGMIWLLGLPPPSG